MTKFKKASLLLSLFENPSCKLMSYMKTIYGDDSDLIAYKTEKYISVLKHFIEKYSDRDVVISRAPGRVNLMGRHIEHRGGNINTVAIHEETIMVAALRDDDTIVLSNTDKKFGDCCFSVSDELNLFTCDNWIEYIDSPEIKERVSSNKGHWSNYVKGAALRFQLEAKKISAAWTLCVSEQFRLQAAFPRRQALWLQQPSLFRK